jgi:glycosyltransferase involved in cell wall biosynthesis
MTLKQIKELINEVNPDYVYLNHLFSPFFVIYPLWLKFRGVLPGRVVLCPRGALYDSALAVKPTKKKIFLQLFKWSGLPERISFHATNKREMQAVLDHFPRAIVKVADNPPKAQKDLYSGVKKDKGLLKCIFIGRVVPIKNLIFVLDLIQESEFNIELNIVGPVEDMEYWMLCQEKIKEMPTSCRVNYVGPLENKELNHLIRQHHLFILPTKGENFGHAIFESLSAGRPVLISDQTPWLNLEQNKAGWDLPLTDMKSFKDKLHFIANMEQDEYDEWGIGAWKFARGFFEKSELHQQYLELFE